MDLQPPVELNWSRVSDLRSRQQFLHIIFDLSLFGLGFSAQVNPVLPPKI